MEILTILLRVNLGKDYRHWTDIWIRKNKFLIENKSEMVVLQMLCNLFWNMFLRASLNKLKIKKHVWLNFIQEEGKFILVNKIFMNTLSFCFKNWKIWICWKILFLKKKFPVMNAIIIRKTPSKILKYWLAWKILEFCLKNRSSIVDLYVDVARKMSQFLKELNICQAFSLFLSKE